MLNVICDSRFSDAAVPAFQAKCGLIELVEYLVVQRAALERCSKVALAAEPSAGCAVLVVAAVHRTDVSSALGDWLDCWVELDGLEWR